MDAPHGLWWCTRRVSSDCHVMVKVFANVPQGAMCHACRQEIHRYDVSTDKPNGKYAHIRRVQARRRQTPHRKRVVETKEKRRICSFDGCRRQVHRRNEFGVVVEHRCLCHYHWKHGEDLLEKY